MAQHNTLGIDFGTSNSAAGIAVNDAPYLIEIEAGNKTLPTSVFFDFDQRRSMFGTAANRALVNGLDGRFMRSLKSVLGTSLMRESRAMMGERLSFIDIIARFLAHIKAQAEAHCRQEFGAALSGRPVHFHSNDAVKDRQALIDLEECYLQAGFKEVSFMFEPEAAALAARKTVDGAGLSLIVDIGGGTSDFTIYRNAATGIDILASHGVRVGGTNFDRSISFDHVMGLFGKGSDIRNELGAGVLRAPNRVFHDLATWQMIPFLYTPDMLKKIAYLHQQALQPKLFARLHSVLEDHLGHDLAFAVEAGKIQANKAAGDLAPIDLSVVERGLVISLSKQMLAQSLLPHMIEIEAGVEETLAMAGCLPDQVETVVFVGGSSLMGEVEQLLAGIFPRAKLQYSDAFTAVVDGLALAAKAA
ncbi:MAG: Hsp70 family protein [Rhodobacteraceae bacterium]|nr:Hsp70 family protein [Paracoccaceae bacterium]